MQSIQDHPIITGFGAAVTGIAMLFALFEVFDYLETGKIEMAKQTEILHAQQQLDERWERDDQQWNHDAIIAHESMQDDLDAIKSDIREIREYLFRSEQEH